MKIINKILFIIVFMLVILCTSCESGEVKKAKSELEDVNSKIEFYEEKCENVYELMQIDYELEKNYTILMNSDPVTYDYADEIEQLSSEFWDLNKEYDLYYGYLQELYERRNKIQARISGEDVL